MQKQYIKNNLFKQSNDSLFQKVEKTNPENKNKVSKDYDTIRELVLEGKKAPRNQTNILKYILSKLIYIYRNGRVIRKFSGR